MKILLINPPRENIICWSAIDWHLDLGDISCFPPVGLMYLASFLNERTSHETRIIDAIADKMNYDELSRQIAGFKPDIVGITAFTFTFYDVLKTAKLAKSCDSSIHVCVGGPHTSLFPEETMSHPEFDSLIVGDGEIAFKELADKVGERMSLGGINGIVYYRENGRLLRTNGPKYIIELDSLPFPSYELLDPSKYYSTFGWSPIATITSSRGCPFQCTYCQVLDKKFRTRSAENIIQEMLRYYDKGVKYFYFFDDMFNIKPDRVIRISELILASRMKEDIKWLFRGRVDAINDNMLELAREAGCSQILLGVEDYTDEGLRIIKKNITIEQAFNAVRQIKEHGIDTTTNWIIGFPHHKSREDICNLISTAIKIDSDYAQFSILQLFPGSEMYEECVRNGGLTEDRWKKYVLDPTEKFYVELYIKYFTAEELSELYRYAHIKYYRRITYVLKHIFKTKSIPEFIIKAKAALNVVK